MERKFQKINSTKNEKNGRTDGLMKKMEEQMDFVFFQIGQIDFVFFQDYYLEPTDF